MSELMIGFLEEYHGDTNGVHDDWGYNLVGFHPLHTLVDALRKGNFPKWSPQVQSLEPAEKSYFCVGSGMRQSNLPFVSTGSVRRARMPSGRRTTLR